jgi:hypothetical protein
MQLATQKYPWAINQFRSTDAAKLAAGLVVN